MRDSTCGRCELGSGAAKEPRNICLMTRPQQHDVMVVAESPTAGCDLRGELFSGRGLKETRDYLNENGIDAYYAYAVKCPRQQDVKLSDKHAKICSEKFLRAEIARVKPKHIIVLGGNALYGATKKKGIADKMGSRFFDEKLGAYIYPTYHHLQVLYDEKNRSQFWGEMKMFIRWIKGEDVNAGFNPPVYICDSVAGLRKMQKMIREAGGLVAADTETMGRNPYLPDKHIRCIQFCWDEKFGGVFVPLMLEEDCYYTNKLDLAGPFWQGKDTLEDAMEVLREILLESWLIGHGFKFDRLWLHCWGERMFGKPILAPNMKADNMHLAYLLDENRPLGQKRLLPAELGFPSYDIADKLTKDMDLFVPYGCRDTVGALMLFKQLWAQMCLPENRRIKKLYTKVIRPADALFTKVELRGWPVSKKVGHEVLEEIDEKIEALSTKILKLLKKQGVEDVAIKDLSKSEKLRPLLFDRLKYPVTPHIRARYTPETKNAKKKILATSSDALLHVKDDPFIAALLELRGLNKARSTYILPMIRMAEARGRLTTVYKLAKTSTGRTASGKEDNKVKPGQAMNLQNLPPKNKVKNLVKARKGFDIIDSDFSQIELRVVAELSKDPLLLRNYRTGGDLHLLRAKRLKKLDDAAWEKLPQKDQEEIRRKAKPANFGLLYKMSAPGFQWYCLSEYDVALSDHEAKHIHKQFYEDHAGLPKWYKKQEAIGKRQGYVENLAGRRRRLPNLKLDPKSSDEANMNYGNAVRQAINAPVQSFASDLKLMAMLEIDERLIEMGYETVFASKMADAYIIGEIHDDIVLEARSEISLEVAQMVREVMSAPRLLRDLGITFTVPISADVKIGPSLGETKKIDWSKIEKRAA